jgi:selenocysteine lyase/cysteine desulfurase
MKRDDHSQRRSFLRKLSAASLAAISLPSLSSATTFHDLLPAVENPDEGYWELVKRQFAVPNRLTMMNAANLCPSPYVINDQVLAYQQALARDVSFQYRAAFAQIRTKSINMLAGFVGVTPAEIGITRNTSESYCTVVNGLDLRAGDEIILWDQNHPSNKESWMNKAKRTGWVVKLVSVPAAPASINDLIDPFAKAFTGRTKLISFSHVSNISGIALPARELCSLARSKGALSLVDGAQSLGFMDLNLRALGCDFYTSSTHKWLMGPLENGLLFVNQASFDRLWPSVIGGGWHDGTKTVDEKICVLGQRNETTPATLPDIIQFHNTIGKARIEARVRALSVRLKTEIRRKVPACTLVTPESEALSGGVVVMNLPGKDPRELAQKLYDNHGIAGANTSGLRLSPHVYNTMMDVDKAVDAIVSLL